MNEQTIIHVEHISKRYILGQINGTTLRNELQRFSAHIHSQEDPTKKIGIRNYQKGDAFCALDDISFDVKAGERVGIIGRNGAGKSTLLKLISRITAPTSGMIGLNGRVASMLEVGTGFHPELTGRENIYMNGAILGMTKREIDRKIEDIIEFSECRRFIDTPVKRYSSGMYVKLAFSVAAHLDSEIMIMDEVLAVGDMTFQNKCLEKMNTVSLSQGRTILYVSHNMNTIRQLCNRCFVLDHGKLKYDGETEEAISQYMQQSKMGFERVVNLETAKRLKGNTRRIMLSKAEILRDNNVYSSEDSMDIVFSVDATDHYDDVRFMMILFYQDGSRIGKTESNNFSVRQGINLITVSVPCSGLADGTYYYEIDILQRSHYSAKETCDCVVDVLPFTISNTEVFGIQGEHWQSKKWGHVMMKPIRIVSQEQL